MMARFAGGGTLGRIAAQFRLQLDEVGEDVGLAAQLVGDHRRLAGDGGDHRDADAAALYCFHQRAEIAVARKQHDLVDVLGELHAGHGLDYQTAETISALPEIAELNIGYFMMGEALFVGLGETVRQMRAAMDRGRQLVPSRS